MPTDIIFPCKKTPKRNSHVEENSHCLMQLGSGVVKTSKNKNAAVWEFQCIRARGLHGSKKVSKSTIRLFA